MYIYSAPGGRPTALRLSEVTGIRLRRTPADDVCISWGVSPQGVRQVYNRIRTTNKRIEREVMLGAGIKCPALWSQDGTAAPKFPLVGRPDYHREGRNLYICRNYRELFNAIRMGSTYFSEYFDKDREIRIHCANGKILFAQDKHIHGVTPGDDPWTIWRPDNWRMDYCLAALNAVKALRLDFGAVDVLYNSRSNDYAICEVNTAPGLTGDFSLRKYASYFSWLQSGTYRREHWDYTTFTKVKSLRWKNAQLGAGQEEEE